jgi:hypothetical protein
MLEIGDFVMIDWISEFGRTRRLLYAISVFDETYLIIGNSLHFGLKVGDFGDQDWSQES